MHYNWNRYYDPATGRYITADPIGLAGGNNLYLYADANPLNMIDPWGLASTVCLYPEAAQRMGHVGIGVPGRGEGTEGFYPKNGKLFDEGVVKKDKYDKKKCITIETDCEEEKCLKNCIEKREKEPGRYRITNRQCTSFVRDCLNECGVPSGSLNEPHPATWLYSLKSDLNKADIKFH